MHPNVHKYYDNASTTPILSQVSELMHGIMSYSFGNPSSIHKFGRESRIIIEDARKKVAQHLKCSIGEVFFTSSATEANNMVLKNAVQYLDVTHIVSSPTEHHCVLHSLDYIRQTYPEVKVSMLSVNEYGEIDLHELKEILQNENGKTLVSLMHGNNEIGSLHNINSVDSICKEYGALFHCDAVQTVGKYNFDLSQMNVSFLTASAHKFHGPKGVGFLYMNSHNIIPGYIHGGAQERNVRAGTENVYAIAGLAEALVLYSSQDAEIRKQVSEIQQYFEEEIIKEIPSAYLHGNPDRSKRMYHVSNVSFPYNPKTELLVFNLDIAGYAVSSGSACSSGIEQDSHVLMAIGHPTDRNAIRFSFSQFNTLQETEKLIQVVKKMVGG
jgi:cysteine desulfurase